MTEEEYNEKREEILKKLEAIQKMQNYLGDALKILQSINKENCGHSARYHEIEDTIGVLVRRSLDLVEAEIAYSKLVKIDKDDSKRQD